MLSNYHQKLNNEGFIMKNQITFQKATFSIYKLVSLIIFIFNF